MKHPIIFYKILSLCFLFINGYSQDFSRDFGIINGADKELSSCIFEPTAGAVILFDIAKLRYIENLDFYEIHLTRLKRIKVLSNQGLNQAQVEIFYFDQEDKNIHDRIETIEAYTINIENGVEQKKKVLKNEIFDSRYNSKFRSKKFVFPDVKIGSILEFKYKIISKNLFYLPSWNFQSNIPTIYSSYSVGMIPLYEYIYKLTGIEKLDFQSSIQGDKPNTDYSKENNFTEMIHTFEMYNVESFTDETFISSKDDYIKSISFQLVKVIYKDGYSREIISTWPKLVENLLTNEKFGDFVSDAAKWSKNNLPQVTDDETKGDLARAKSLISYVKSNFKWDGINSFVTSKDFKSFKDDLTGNSAEINLFLLGLLKAAKIEAYPVILSTRDNGKIRKEFPFLDVFNYVVIIVGSGEELFYTDGTDSELSYNRTPLSTLNGEGLIVDKQKMLWVNLDSKISSKSIKTVVMNVDSLSLDADVTVSLQNTDYSSVYYKKMLKKDTLEIIKYLSEKGFENVDRIKLANYDNPEKTYIMAFKAKYKLELLNEMIIVRPLLSFPMEENKLKEDHRFYPLDFIYLELENINAIINIPSGYKIKEGTKKLNINNDLVEIKYDFFADINVLKFDTVFRLKKAIYPPEEYNKLKEYFEELITVFNQDIILYK